MTPLLTRLAFILALTLSAAPAAYADVTVTTNSANGGATTGTTQTVGGSGGQTTGAPQTVGGSGGQTLGSNTTGSTLQNPLKGGGSLEQFISNILAFVVRIGAIVVVLMLIYVGFLFVQARGEPDKISEARQALLWTIVGALILLGAQAISLGIESTVAALSGGS